MHGLSPGDERARSGDAGQSGAPPVARRSFWVRNVADPRFKYEPGFPSGTPARLFLGRNVSDPQSNLEMCCELIHGDPRIPDQGAQGPFCQRLVKRHADRVAALALQEDVRALLPDLLVSKALECPNGFGAGASRQLCHPRLNGQLYVADLASWCIRGR